MIAVPILAALIGAMLAVLANIGPVRGIAGQYLAVACLAGLDAVCGGVRAGIQGDFRRDVFLTGFLFNVVFAFGLAWLGDHIYINLFLAVGLILGSRIYQNLSLIRRDLLKKAKDAHERRKLLQAASLEAGA